MTPVLRTERAKGAAAQQPPGHVSPRRDAARPGHAGRAAARLPGGQRHAFSSAALGAGV